MRGIIITIPTRRSWICPLHRCFWGQCWCRVPAWHPDSDLAMKAAKQALKDARLTVERLNHGPNKS